MLSKPLAALTLLLALTTYAQTPPPAPQPPACISAQYRQFDFWLGEWTVYNPAGKQAGENRIERIANGCALLENWRGSGGGDGKSLNIYDNGDGQWHQSWVDSSGSRLELAGGFANGAMVLQGSTPDPQRAGAVIAQRITWRVNADNSVRQLWESSSDGGKTWTVAFDGKYVRKPKP
jgi:hypothetical protein